MKICKENNALININLPPLIKGNLYENLNNGYIYIYNKYSNNLVNLETGDTYADTGYGLKALEDKWVDVTDNYCLQKIK